MNTYWIVVKKKVVVAALYENPNRDTEEFLEELKELGHSGPIRWVLTTGEIVIGMRWGTY